MSRLRICLVSTTAPDRPGGSMVRYGRMVRAALERYAADDVRMEALPLAPDQAWLDRFPRKWQTPIRYARIAASARRLLPRRREGLLHLLDGSHAYLLQSAGPLAVPLVSTVHDLIPALRLKGEAGLPPLGGAGAWLARRTVTGLKRAAAWVADSGHTRDDLLRLAGVPASRVHVVHPAVIPPEPAGGKAPMAGSAPYVLHVAGNNTFYKNRQGVIEIFKRVRPFISVGLKMVGAPPDAALLETVKASGMESAIEFRTDVSETDLAALYRGAALLLFPSLYEGFGWPPLEAMAQGCPVVCSDAGSLPEVVGDAALVAPAGNLSAFQESCLRLLREPDLRARLIEAGFQRVRNFSLEALASGFMAVYRSVEAAR